MKLSFYAFYVNFVQSVAKTVKENVFSHLLREVLQKLKKRCFLAFYANFVQSVTKNVKKYCFLKLFAKRRSKSSKTAV